MPEGAVDLRSVHSSRRKATREVQPKASQGGLDRFGAEGGLLASGRAGARDGRGPWVGLSGIFDTSEYEAIAREAQVLNSVPRLLQGKEGKRREGLAFLRNGKKRRGYDRRASRRGSVTELEASTLRQLERVYKHECASVRVCECASRV